MLTARVFEFSTSRISGAGFYSQLVRLAETAAPSRNDVVLAGAEHQDIATRISTHREAVTREITHLERLGIVQRQGRKLKIRDVALLRALLLQEGE